MKRVLETFQLPFAPEAFWGAFFDEAYVRALYLEGFGFPKIEVLAIGHDSRKIRVVPKLNVPASLAKLVGDAFSYEEHGALDREKNLWTWKMVPAPGALDLVGTHGSARLDAKGEGSVRSDELVIEGKLFGLGRLIESAAEKEARTAWSKEVPFMTQWIAQGRSTRSAPPTSTAPSSAR